MSDPIDPKGLIAEAYRIEEIGDAECRSIFVDWSLSLPEDVDAAVAVAAHYAVYARDRPDHPMTVVLREGLRKPASPVRRGGSRGRRS